ncbi:endoribonuclease Dicer-like protein 3-like [Gossypium australe]|uniref:Endoribonuclease Dicer-like protein 3-like n=1 Tax=Gossypium australe TaxID=47621 RepID=A0A5B6W5R9_9ROSI|nr:endoribonuclease Dicer-like protein 3-like [Gossypium australe]
MKEFYHKSNNKPKIFEMTASPVVSKGALSSNDCEDQISELENVMGCMFGFESNDRSLVVKGIFSLNISDANASRNILC